MELADGHGRCRVQAGKNQKAYLRIEQLQTKLQGKALSPKASRARRGEHEKILTECGAGRWMRAEITERKEPVYRQEKRGRPGDKTKYLRRERLRFSVAARVKDEVIIADERSDGMFPLITNCRDLPCKEILAAYKFQPSLQKRHEQLKTVQELAPVWLKNVSRIEALLFLYFIALLVHALLEREVRLGMAKANITSPAPSIRKSAIAALQAPSASSTYSCPSKGVT